MSAALRSLLLPGLFTLLGVAGLIGLGAWQLERLAWKEALIAEVSGRVGAPPVDAPPEADWAKLAPGDYEYRHVSLVGTYEFAHQVLVFRALDEPRGRFGGPGYLVLTPLRLADGSDVIVNRGFIPFDQRNSFAETQQQTPGPVIVSGLMRAS